MKPDIHMAAIMNSLVKRYWCSDCIYCLHFNSSNWIYRWQFITKCWVPYLQNYIALHPTGS